MGELNYSEKVMDHFLHPRNVGEMPDAGGKTSLAVTVQLLEAG